MPELILHHYDVSAFSERVRLAMGLKGLRYRSVLIPPLMPSAGRMESPRPAPALAQTLGRRLAFGRAVRLIGDDEA